MICNGMSIQKHFFENAKIGDKFYWYENRLVHTPYTEWSFSGISDEIIDARSISSVTLKEAGVIPRVGFRKGIWVPSSEQEVWFADSVKADKFLDLYDRVVKIFPHVLGVPHFVTGEVVVARLKDRLSLMKKELEEVEWILKKAEEHGDLRSYVEGVTKGG